MKGVGGGGGEGGEKVVLPVSAHAADLSGHATRSFGLLCPETMQDALCVGGKGCTCRPICWL